MAMDYPRWWDFTCEKQDTVYEQVATNLNISRTEIEDAYQCTPLQEALITLSSAGSGAYVKRILLSLCPDINLERFRSAVEDVVRSIAVFRTRITQCSGIGFVQTVLSDEINWCQEDSLEEYLERTKAEKWSVGDPLSRYTLIKDSKRNTRWFVRTIHHALYDGWSFPLMADMVSKTYAGIATDSTPQYKYFVQYIMRKNYNGGREYWQSEFAGTQCTQFPMLPHVSYFPTIDTTIQQHCPPFPKVKGITRTTLLHATWAIVLNQFNSGEDSAFGTVVSGRDEPVVGIKNMIGPTIATVPVCIRVDESETILEYLERLQKQALTIGYLAVTVTAIQNARELSLIGSSRAAHCGFFMPELGKVAPLTVIQNILGLI